MRPIGEIDEASLRLGVFLIVFAIMALLEVFWPRRVLVANKMRRWVTNLSVVALGTVVVRIMALAPAALGVAILPLVAVGAALHAEKAQVGLLNLVNLPGWLEIAIGLLVLDFAIWLQHWASHRFELLWRLHRVHHADRDIDVTTALRFHPVEIALSMLYKVVWVMVFGPSVVAVVLFEVILNGAAIFNHANFKMPIRFDQVLRLLIVTPDMHRVHHSIEPGEHHSNFGFNLSIWDRLFGTYVAQPVAGHEFMTIGLGAYQHGGPTELGYSLMIPFRNGKTIAGSRRG